MASQPYLPIPTSTSTPANDDNSSVSSLLSSSGSPPLIVAFFAIGLFIVAVLAVFAWRRISHSRRGYPQPVTTLPRPKPASLGKRPILVDVWVDCHVHEKAPLGATRWECITPLAAILTWSEQSPVVQAPPIRSTDPDDRVLSWRRRLLVSAVKRFYAPQASPSPPPPPAPPPVEPEKGVLSSTARMSDETEWGDRSSLQVSVTIAMPTPRRRRSGTEEGEAGVERTALGEFCIGTTDVPWSGDGNDID